MKKFMVTSSDGFPKPVRQRSVLTSLVIMQRRYWEYIDSSRFAKKYMAIEVDQRYMLEALSISMNVAERSRQRHFVLPSIIKNVKKLFNSSISSKLSYILGTLDLLMSNIMSRQVCSSRKTARSGRMIPLKKSKKPTSYNSM